MVEEYENRAPLNEGFTKRIHVLCNHFLNNYEPYLQLSSLCGNVCSYNLVVITTNGLMR
jgi:hypothetical protein